MEFLFDPTLWVGLLTLVVLELVLGIDNLVFIAILAKKLPAKQQDRALYTGLGMAIFLRLALLSVMSWLVGLTAPLFTLWGHSFSLRDLILCAGGLFLLFKATSELHERLEARPHEESAAGSATSFGDRPDFDFGCGLLLGFHYYGRRHGGQSGRDDGSSSNCHRSHDARQPSADGLRQRTSHRGGFVLVVFAHDRPLTRG
jgi:hypothetical protein